METQANVQRRPPEANDNIRKEKIVFIGHPLMLVFQEWLDENFQKDTRLNFYIFMSENILTPEALKSMYRVHKTVNNINIRGQTFADICERVHIADIFLA